MSYPDVVIACIEHKVSLEAFQSRQATLKWHDKQYEGLFPGGWPTITITAGSFKLFSLWQSQHAVCHCQESGKTQLNYCNALVIKWIYNIVLFGGKNAGCSFFITFNWCICSLFWRWSPTASFNELVRNSRTLFAQRRCYFVQSFWLGKRMLRVVVLRVLFFVRHSFSIQCRWFVLSEVVFVHIFTLSWCRSINTIPAS